MKKQTLKPLANLSKMELAELTKEVKETLARGITVIKCVKTFTSADLWNIQRQRKSITRRKFIF